MAQTLRTSGDLIERANIAFIEGKLPAYIAIWESFIGNDGSAHLAGQSLLAPRTAADRAILSYYSYTALESALCARRLAEESRTLVIPPLDADGAAEEYLRVMDLLIAFFSHVGRMVDCARRLAAQWKDKSLAKSLDDFYQQRNTILHDAKVPTFIADGVLEIVEPRGIEEDQKRWSRDSRWEDTVGMTRVQLGDFLPRTLDLLLVEYNNFLERLRAKHLAAGLKQAFDVLASLADNAPTPLNVSASANVSILSPSPKRKNH